VTRQSFSIGIDEPRWRGDGWSIGEDHALPKDFTLEPGESRSVRVELDLPPGEYEVLFGYGGGTHECRGVMSNSIPLDVG
jgi:hypothetical protein